jgi:subfamily B ATP-binding cassette protein MsbA
MSETGMKERRPRVSSRLLHYALRYKARFALGLIATAVMGSLDTVVAGGTGLLAKVLSGLASNGGGAGRVDFPLTIPIVNVTYRVTSFSVIYLLAAAIFATVLVKSLFVYGREYFMNSASNKVLLNLRADFFDKVLGLPMRYFAGERTGAVMSRFTTDIGNIDQAITAGISTTQNAIYTVIFTAALLLTSWKLTLLAVLIFPFSGLIIKTFGEKIRATSRRISLNFADISAFLQERISGIKVIKAFVLEDRERARFAQKLRDNYRYSMRNVRHVALLKPINEILNNAGIILVVLFCSWQFVHGHMKIDVITRFIVLTSMVYKPLKELGNSTAVFQRALASAARVFELLDLEQESRAGAGLPKSAVRGDVEFRDVTFAYRAGVPVLERVSFRARPGETVALVGPSGAGKSTVVHLLQRFYDADQGAILVDGVDLRTVALSSLRALMGSVSQETVLFADTVRENIRYGKADATDDEVEEAARVANAHGFITELNEAYETYIGERGVQLSGGQRQRIAIARAVLSDPRILLLDEATSALDNESEALVQEALDRMRRDRTSIVVAHRLSTIYGADRIVVFDGGRVVDTGRHAELVARSGLYRRLYEMQFDFEKAEPTIERNSSSNPSIIPS